MKKVFLVLAVMIMVLGFAKLSNAALINGGFETGDFSGWTFNGTYLSNGNVVSGFDTYTPRDGTYFAWLMAGLGQNTYTTLSQSLSLSAGDTLAGLAAFDSQESSGFNDDAYVRILDGGTIVAIPWSSSVSEVGGYVRGPWQNWSWTALASGQYILQFGVANQGDNQVNSYAVFDANTLTSSGGVIPEPATLSLIGFGLLGLYRLRKKIDKKRKE